MLSWSCPRFQEPESDPSTGKSTGSDMGLSAPLPSQSQCRWVPSWCCSSTDPMKARLREVTCIAQGHTANLDWLFCPLIPGCISGHRGTSCSPWGHIPGGQRGLPGRSSGPWHSIPQGLPPPRPWLLSAPTWEGGSWVGPSWLCDLAPFYSTPSWGCSPSPVI